MRGKVRRVRKRKEARKHNTDTLTKRREVGKIICNEATLIGKICIEACDVRTGPRRRTYTGSIPATPSKGAGCSDKINNEGKVAHTLPLPTIYLQLRYGKH